MSLLSMTGRFSLGPSMMEAGLKQSIGQSLSQSINQTMTDEEVPTWLRHAKQINNQSSSQAINPSRSARYASLSNRVSPIITGVSSNQPINPSVQAFTQFRSRSPSSVSSNGSMIKTPLQQSINQSIKLTPLSKGFGSLQSLNQSNNQSMNQSFHQFVLDDDQNDCGDMLFQLELETNDQSVDQIIESDDESLVSPLSSENRLIDGSIDNEIDELINTGSSSSSIPISQSLHMSHNHSYNHYQTTNQSSLQSLNQSMMNQSINQSGGMIPIPRLLSNESPSRNHSLNYSMNQSIARSVPVNLTIKQSINPSNNQLSRATLGSLAPSPRPVGFNQLTNQTIPQPMNNSPVTRTPFGQSMNQPINPNHQLSSRHPQRGSYSNQSGNQPLYHQSMIHQLPGSYNPSVQQTINHSMNQPNSFTRPAVIPLSSRGSMNNQLHNQPNYHFNPMSPTEVSPVFDQSVYQSNNQSNSRLNQRRSSVLVRPDSALFDLELWSYCSKLLNLFLFINCFLCWYSI